MDGARGCASPRIYNRPKDRGPNKVSFESRIFGHGTGVDFG